MDWVAKIRAIVVQIGLRSCKQGWIAKGAKGAKKGALEVYNHTLPGGLPTS